MTRAAGTVSAGAWRPECHCSGPQGPEKAPGSPVGDCGPGDVRPREGQQAQGHMAGVGRGGGGPGREPCVTCQRVQAPGGLGQGLAGEEGPVWVLPAYLSAAGLEGRGVL